MCQSRAEGEQAALGGVAHALANRQEYSDCLAFLECMPRDVFVHTQVIEWALLELLDVIQLLLHNDHKVDAEIGLHETRMLALMRSALQAKSLDVPFIRYPSKFHSLRSYASRALHRHEVLLDDPGFWPWLDNEYPHVSKFLHTNDSQIKKTNDFINILSIHFKRKKEPVPRAYMAAVDCLCRQVLEICAGRTCDYARKAADSFAAAKMEMVVLVAISKNFRLERIDPAIPGCGKLADLSFEYNGDEHYVEVYSHADYDMAGTVIKECIVPEEEWGKRFEKTQIKFLQEAGVPTVYVMSLSDPQAQPGGTETPAFRDAAASAMPKDSDIVVITSVIEVASLRGGQFTDPSTLAENLQKAIEAELS